MSIRLKILPVVLLLLWSCNAFRGTTEFTVEHKTTFTVEPTAPITFPTPEVTTHSKQTFENHDTKASLVEEVRLRNMKLTIVSPESTDFSFLEEIVIYLSTDNEPEIQIAHLSDVPQQAQQIELITTDSKLDPYLKAEEYTIRTKTTTDETIAREIDIQAKLKFYVKAKTKIFS